MDLKMALLLLQTFDWKDSENRIYEFDISIEETIALYVNGRKRNFYEKIY